MATALERENRMPGTNKVTAAKKKAPIAGVGGEEEVRTIGGRKIEDIYQKKTQLEHILLRPDTYVGSIERNTADMWVFHADTSRIVRRSVSYVPGLYKIFDEIIVNAADNKQRDPTMSMLKVTVDKAAGSISVWNNGRGIPIARHAEHGCYIPELIFGHLLTGSNFNDQEKKTTGGRNGYGAKLANIFSTEFVVETADGATRKRYRQVFRNNMGDKDEPVIKDYDGDEFTCITFKPDWRRFGMAGMEDDTEALLQKRAHDIAGCMSSYGGKRVRVYLNKQQLDVKSFRDYLGLYEGLSDLVLHERIGTWDIAIGPSDGQLQQVSFVNAICTVKGGQHVTHIAEQIVAHLVKVVKRKSKGTEVKPVHVRNHLCVCVNALVENPAFDSQSKETLTTKASAFGGADLKLSDKALKAIEKSPIVEAILAYTNFQASKALDKKSGKKTNKLTGITKLDDANFAGTKHSQDCTLILTEGDSAKTLAVSGLGVVGRDYYGVFPLKGKPLNVRETAHAAVSKNEEISNIVKILGLKFGTQYADARALRYGHLMIMTDQDHDGSHIKGLLINFLHYFWPSLLRVEGFLLEFITPIVKCVRAGRELSFFTVPEYETWRAAHAQQRGWSIKYYKGLGTSTAKEAKEYFAKLDQHQIPFEWRNDAADGDMVDLVFNKKRAEDRKEWLRNFVPGTFVDYGVDAMTYDAFFNRELILFSIEDNKRSLPCMVDGLKPSQRKVLFACFKRKLKNEIKVAQLAGYVSEHSAYHHGEVSLTGTITAMAQSYCGSNNVALLYPGGQFGTRLMGGKDQASPRYIFTRLDKVARAIFHPDDDAILTYLDDDGMSIEPAYYVPVLPLVLVNGAEGIGTGWSSGVPNYSPRDVMENLRRRIRGQPMVEMQPWYRGFVGTIARKAGGAKGSSFTVEGIVERTGDETLEITELPVKKWTQDYKAFLESLIAGADPKEKAGAGTKGKAAAKPAPKKKAKAADDDEDGDDADKKSPTKAAAKPRFHIKDFRENHTDTTVHFTITMDKSDLDAIEQQPGGLSKFFKLETTLAETNMTLFDNKGMIARYESPLQIMEEFYDLRLRHYGMRKEHLLARMQKEWMRLDNKVRFVVAVVQGKLEVRNRKKSELLAQLRADGFDPLLPESAAKSVGAKAKAEDEGDEDAAAALDDDSDSESAALAKGYDYLLGLKLWTLTKEVVAKLLAELAAKKQEMEELRAMELSDLWLRDLDAVAEALDAVDDMHVENARAESKQRRNAGKGGGGGASKTKKGGRKRAADSDDSDFESQTPHKRSKKNKGRAPPVGPPPPTPAVHSRSTEVEIEGGVKVSEAFAAAVAQGKFGSARKREALDLAAAVAASRAAGARSGGGDNSEVEVDNGNDDVIALDDDDEIGGRGGAEEGRTLFAVLPPPPAAKKAVKAKAKKPSAAAAAAAAQEGEEEEEDVVQSLAARMQAKLAAGPRAAAAADKFAFCATDDDDADDIFKDLAVVKAKAPAAAAKAVAKPAAAAKKAAAKPAAAAVKPAAAKAAAKGKAKPAAKAPRREVDDSMDESSGSEGGDGAGERVMATRKAAPSRKYYDGSDGESDGGSASDSGSDDDGGDASDTFESDFGAAKPVKKATAAGKKKPAAAAAKEMEVELSDGGSGSDSNAFMSEVKPKKAPAAKRPAATKAKAAAVAPVAEAEDDLSGSEGGDESDDFMSDVPAKPAKKAPAAKKPAAAAAGAAKPKAKPAPAVDLYDLDEAFGSEAGDGDSGSDSDASFAAAKPAPKKKAPSAAAAAAKKQSVAAAAKPKAVAKRVAAAMDSDGGDSDAVAVVRKPSTLTLKMPPAPPANAKGKAPAAKKPRAGGGGGSRSAPVDLDSDDDGAAAAPAPKPKAVPKAAKPPAKKAPAKAKAGAGGEKKAAAKKPAAAKARKADSEESESDGDGGGAAAASRPARARAAVRYADSDDSGSDGVVDLSSDSE